MQRFSCPACAMRLKAPDRWVRPSARSDVPTPRPTSQREPLDHRGTLKSATSRKHGIGRCPSITAVRCSEVPLADRLALNLEGHQGDIVLRAVATGPGFDIP